MQSAAKLCFESKAAYQISPTPILGINEFAKKEVGGRGGALIMGLGFCQDPVGSGSPHYCICFRWNTQFWVAFLLRIHTYAPLRKEHKLRLPGSKYLSKPTSPNGSAQSDGFLPTVPLGHVSSSFCFRDHTQRLQKRALPYIYICICMFSVLHGLLSVAVLA